MSANRSIKVLGLSVRSVMVLQAEGITEVEQLVSLVSTRGPKALLIIPNLGRASADEIIQACFRLFEGATAKGQTWLRDEFASSVAAGDAAADRGWESSISDEALVRRAQLYYRVADAMLAAREAAP